MKIKLYTTNSSNNTVNKELESEIEIDVNLIDSTSKSTPVIRIKKTEDIEKSIPKYNYCYIGAPFNRYYYINDCTSLMGHMWEFNLNVDVLMSFKNTFMNLKAIVERNSNNFNTYIPDDSYVIQNRTRTQVKEFPSGFDADNLILVCCG